MRKRKWYKIYSSILLGILALCEIFFAYLKNHPVTPATPHWFVTFYDPIRDYRGAYLAFGLFAASLPAFRYLKRYYEILSLTKSWDRDRVEMAVDEEHALKIHHLKHLIASYRKDLKEFEKNRELLGIYQPVQLKFKHYEDLDCFKENQGNSSMNFIPNNLTQDIFSAAVVGPSGIGKSYTLLQRITQALVAIDQENEEEVKKAKLPLFLKLGNYKSIVNADTTEHLELWISEQLEEVYEIEHKESIKWLINNKHIIPVLDGLDEVPELEREDCLQAISKYYRSGRAILFSCRKDELTSLIAAPSLGFRDLTVYELLRLTREDIRREIGINRLPAETAGLFDYLERHDDLWERISAPLILNLFQKTYTLLTPEEVEDYRNRSTDEFLTVLWKKYDEYIFKHKNITPYQAIRLKIYAGWIAKLSTDTSFFLDKIQPVWLKNSAGPNNGFIATGLKLLYFLTSRIISAVLIAIAVGLIISEWFSFISNGIFAGILLSVYMLFQQQRDLNVTGWKKVKDIMILSFGLMIACGYLQGIAVPRRHEDMNGIFAVTECFPGILLGLFSGIVFGYRSSAQSSDEDIKPVEKFTFDWKHFWTQGLIGGCAVGVLIGLCGIVVQIAFQHSTFYSWFGPYIKVMLSGLYQATGIQLSGSSIGTLIIVFLFAFAVAFSVGFIVVALLSGRDENEIKELDAHKKKKLNYGIYRSGIQSVRHGAISAGGLSFVYGLILYLSTGRYESIGRAIEIGSGVGIISFLWFGGFEVIQHWTLRLYLFLYGVLPLRIGPWLKCMHQVAFLQRHGSRLEFQHVTLKEYLSSIVPANNEIKNSEFKFILGKRKLIVLMAIVILFFSANLLYSPFKERFVSKRYWQGSDQLNMVANDSVYTRTGTNSVLINKTGNLDVDVEGKVIVGTFVGKVGPEGTLSGFLGFPVGNAYNTVKNFRHGALLYRKKELKSAWSYVAKMDQYYWPWSERKGRISVKAGDELVFCINDSEWENDTDVFTLAMNMAKDQNK